MDVPKVYDQEGDERDWHWLIANFGAIRVERAQVPEGASHVYRIVKLQDAEGPAVKIVHVEDEAGKPQGGIRVVRHWPDAPQLPEWPPPASRWQERGVYGDTNVNGDIGFGMGRGDYYFPPEGGASAVWVASSAGPSDYISGLGMLGGTNHRHIDVFYQLQAVEGKPPEPSPTPTPPPTPTPTPTPTPHPPEEEDNWEKLFNRLDRMIELLEQLSS
jgi:hypothetical protein